MKKILTSLIIAAAMTSCGGNSSNLNIAELPSTDQIQSIPLPPVGQRWVVNEQFSDEFNGTELDETKWRNTHPSWIGRAPGLFTPENIAFRDGCMVLHGEKMDSDTVINGQTFNISCAAVISKKREAHYGYYECRFKANKTTLSSTFWLSTPGAVFPTEGRQVDKNDNGKFHQELDICECIGRGGDFQGSFFSKGMNSNMHYWITPQGAKAVEDRRAKESRLARPDGALLSEDFNVFGCWWRNDRSASFYLNNEQETNREFIARKTHNDPYDNPFRLTEPMTINLVVETYPQPWIELPNDEELANPELNSTLYDWVRSYVLVDVADKNSGAASMDMFQNIVHIASESISEPLSVQYTASEDCQLKLAVYSERGEQIASELVDAPAGYANLSLESDILKSSDSSPICYVSASLVSPQGEELSVDSFKVDL